VRRALTVIAVIAVGVNSTFAQEMILREPIVWSAAPEYPALEHLHYTVVPRPHRHAESRLADARRLHEHFDTIEFPAFGGTCGSNERSAWVLRWNQTARYASIIQGQVQRAYETVMRSGDAQLAMSAALHLGQMFETAAAWFVDEALEECRLNSGLAAHPGIFYYRFLDRAFEAYRYCDGVAVYFRHRESECQQGARSLHAWIDLDPVELIGATRYESSDRPAPFSASRAERH
jgi:hypothetical protein